MYLCICTCKYDIYRINACWLILLFERKNIQYTCSGSNRMNEKLFWQNKFPGIAATWQTTTVIQLFSFDWKRCVYFNLLEKRVSAIMCSAPIQGNFCPFQSWISSLSLSFSSSPVILQQCISTPTSLTMTSIICHIKSWLLLGSFFILYV